MGKLTICFTFTIGFAAGVGATWKYFDNKYAEIAQEEIDSVKAAFSNKPVDNSETDDVGSEDQRSAAEQALDKPSIMEYAAKLQNEGYTNYSNREADNKSEKTQGLGHGDKPYVISPDEFGELPNYEKISLTFYADGVLADDQDELVDDIEEIVGTESLNHFGEYEDDSVFVRNDAKRCDYEILMDRQNYSEAIKRRPH